MLHSLKRFMFSVFIFAANLQHPEEILTVIYEYWEFRVPLGPNF